jgi:hypothetical protein
VLQTSAPSAIGSPAKHVLPEALWSQIESLETPHTAVLEKEVGLHRPKWKNSIHNSVYSWELKMQSSQRHFP